MAESAPAAQQAPEKEKPKGKEAEQGPPKKSKKKILLLAIGVILVGVLGGGGFFAYKTFVKGKKSAKPMDETSKAIEDAKKEAKDPESAAKEKEKEKEASKKEGKEGEGKKGEKGSEEKSLFYSFTQTVSTNLKGSTRRVVAQVWVEAVDEEALKKIEKSELYMQNALVLLFSGKTVEDVTSEEGKEMLLKEMKIRLDKVFEKDLIKQVGFSGISTF